MTVTGQVKTLTITPAAPPAQTAQAQTSKDGGFFSDSGKVAGVFVVVALAILALAGFLIWFFLRRRKHAEAIPVASVAGADTPQRQPSKLSQMGLLGGSARQKGEKVVPGIQTSGWGSDNNVEKSPTDTTPIDRRSSYPRIVDQRLDPVALWNPLHDNGSHVSIRSLQDNQDYSRRMLRVSHNEMKPRSTIADLFYRLQTPINRFWLPACLSSLAGVETPPLRPLLHSQLAPGTTLSHCVPLESGAVLQSYTAEQDATRLCSTLTTHPSSTARAHNTP